MDAEMNKSYTIKDWCDYLSASRATVWRYMKAGKIPPPVTTDPRPRWDAPPNLNGFQPNQTTIASS